MLRIGWRFARAVSIESISDHGARQEQLKQYEGHGTFRQLQDVVILEAAETVLDLLQETGFQPEVAGIHLAIDFMIPANQADTFDLGAHFQGN